MGEDSDAVRAELAQGTTISHVCQRATDLIFRECGAVSTVLLRVHEGLRCFASTGMWRTAYALPLESGSVGEAYRSGRTLVDYPINPVEAAYPMSPGSVMAACVPIRDPGREMIGVLKLEWDHPVEAIAWQAVAEPAVAALGDLVIGLGYSPAESVAERLVRHALSISAADEESVLMGKTLRAARQISGLSSAVMVITRSNQSSKVRTERDPGPMAEAVRRMNQAELGEIVELTHRAGTWYSRSAPPSRACCRIAGAGAKTIIAIPVGVRASGRHHSELVKRTLLLLDEQSRPVNSTMVCLLELLATQALISEQRLELIESMRTRAGQDPLTGLGHQVSLGERISQTAPGRTVLLLIDVDHFKEINDSLGHTAGDSMLVELAEALQGTMRSSDELYRFGGDEFVAVVEVHHIAEARSIAKRLIKAAHWVGCTVSVGAAAVLPGEDPEDTLRRADAAMYQAKRDGRDRASFAPMTVAAPQAGPAGAKNQPGAGGVAQPASSRVDSGADGDADGDADRDTEGSTVESSSGARSDGSGR